MAEEVEAESNSLETTPTWAVATVCFVLLFVSITIEHLLHLSAKYFNKKRRKALIKALDQIKSDLMLLGFITLFLTVTEDLITKICIPASVTETFLPCSSIDSTIDQEEGICPEGKVSLLSSKGVNELQYLIFMLASWHSLSCILIFGLGMAKMRRWESWEAETRTLDYRFSKDPRRFVLTHQTSFGKRHLRYWSENGILRWPACFLRQFFGSVHKVDYLTLRHGFITAHFHEGSSFDFQKYIKRALEKDFGVVMKLSFWIWIFSVAFIFFNAHKFYSYLWLPFIPLVMLLLVGTKLQGVITAMCLDSHDKSQIARGTLLVTPSDRFFWFRKPTLLLHLIHFILFQNSFQLAFFTWSWIKFGLRSCFHRQTEDIIIRLGTGVLVLLLCSYVSLPLYALVTQMGTTMRKAVFTENVVTSLKQWRRRARKRLRKSYLARPSLDTSLSLDSSPSFSTLDASPSVEFGQHLAIEVVEDESGSEIQHEKNASFEGFLASEATTSSPADK